MAETGRQLYERIRPIDDRWPEEARQRIAEAVAQPRPPDRWLTFHDERGRPYAQIPSRAWFEWHWQRGLYPGDNEGRRLPSHIREAVIARDGMVCGLCGGAVESRQDIHIDHIHPYSLGGSSDPDNLQVTHAVCNMQKGNRVGS